MQELAEAHTTIKNGSPPAPFPYCTYLPLLPPPELGAEEVPNPNPPSATGARTFAAREAAPFPKVESLTGVHDARSISDRFTVPEAAVAAVVVVLGEGKGLDGCRLSP